MTYYIRMCRKAGAVTIQSSACWRFHHSDLQVYKIYRHFSIAVINVGTTDGKVHKRGSVLNAVILEINHPVSVFRSLLTQGLLNLCILFI